MVAHSNKVWEYLELSSSTVNLRIILETCNSCSNAAKSWAGIFPHTGKKNSLTSLTKDNDKVMAASVFSAPYATFQPEVKWR